MPKVSHSVSATSQDQSAFSGLMDVQAQTLFELASEGLLLVESASQVIVAANRAACVGLGYAPTQLCNRPLSALIQGFGPQAKGELPSDPVSLAHPGGESYPEPLSLAAIAPHDPASLALYRQEGGLWHVQATVHEDFLPGYQLWQLQPIAVPPESVAMPAASVIPLVSETSPQEAQQRYEDLLHSLDGIVWEFDLLSERFTFVSQKLEKILGYTPEQWLADASLWQSSIHPDDREAVLSACFSLSQVQDDFHIEYRMLTATGAVVWIRDFVTVVKVQQQPVKLRGVLVDISDRKQVEEQLEASQRLTQQILDISPDILYLYDLSTQQLTYLNNRVTELMGYLPEELQALDGAGLLDLIHPADRDRVSAIVQQLMAAEPGTTLETEFRVLRADGEWRWLHSCQTLMVSPDPTPTPLFFGTVQDIHDRKLAEKSLRDSEKQFRTLTEALPAAVLIFQDTDILYVNSAATVITGYGREQLLNLSLDNLIHPDCRQSFWDKHWTLATHPGAGASSSPQPSPLPLQTEVKILTQAGETRWLAFCERSIEFAGQRATLGIAFDISDRKRAEAALQAREAQIRLITDSVPCLIAYVDAQQRYQFVNQQYANWFGRDRDHIVGRQMRTILKTTDYRQVQPHIKTVLQGQPVDFDAILLDCHQQAHDVHVSYIPHHHTDGRVLGFYVLIEDVTTLKQSERRWRESEARYRSVVEAISEGILLQQADGQIIACNTAAERILGLSQEQILGTTATDPIWWTIHEDGSPFLAQDYPMVVALRTGQPQSHVIMGVYRPDGHLRWLLVNAQPIFAADGQTPQASVVSFSDITERRAAEQHLRSQELRLRLALDAAALGTWEWLAPDAPWLTGSERTQAIYGLPAPDNHIDRAALWERIHPDDRERVAQAIATSFAQQTSCHLEYRLQLPDSEERWVAVWATVFTAEGDAPPQMTGIVRDITQHKQAEAALRYQSEQEYLMRVMTQHIHESLDLDQILNTAVAEVHQFLQVDRVLVYQLHPLDTADATPDTELPAAGGTGRTGHNVTVRAEAVSAGCPSMLGWLLRDPWLQSATVLADLQAGLPYIVTDLQALDLPSATQDFLAFFQIEAILMVPIRRGEALWGVLVAHDCHAPRSWSQVGMNLLLQLVDQISIAIQQAELYQTVQDLNQNLEQQVQERTAQLEQMLHFEALLQRITDKVRGSIDEDQILQAAVQELALGLNLTCCDTGIYNPEQTVSTIRHEYTQNLPSAQGASISLAESMDAAVYAQLLRGEYCQFCFIASGVVRPVRRLYAIMTCPIVDDQGVIGDLWLFKRQSQVFSDSEIRLVQQVANHCAIGIRQARLYVAAQAQVAELGRLNRLKDDFLSTISHELRTPLSNMNNAIQMLELFLTQPNLFQEAAEVNLRLTPSRAISYLQILRHQYQEELNLVNDLLDLSRLEAGRVSLELTTLNLSTWVPCVLELFDDRIRSQNQRLYIDIEPTLPLITTDRIHLEHILKELVNNACKYTPPGQAIHVQVSTRANQVYLTVSNSGVTIPPEELPHLFEKFYRVPSADPWKYGGTGLGLALVDQRVKQLGGRIWAESKAGITRFTVELPQIIATQPSQARESVLDNPPQDTLHDHKAE